MNEATEYVEHISGRLTMETAAVLFSKGLPFAESRSEIVIDFAQVETVDSSAVSLMLSWLRTAENKNVKLAFTNVPDSLRSLANLYGVAEPLSLGVDA